VPRCEPPEDLPPRWALATRHQSDGDPAIVRTGRPTCRRTEVTLSILRQGTEVLVIRRSMAIRYSGMTVPSRRRAIALAYLMGWTF
jgi:hypothetical protein